MNRRTHTLASTGLSTFPAKAIRFHFECTHFCQWNWWNKSKSFDFANEDGTPHAEPFPFSRIYSIGRKFKLSIRLTKKICTTKLEYFDLLCTKPQGWAPPAKQIPHFKLTKIHRIIKRKHNHLQCSLGSVRGNGERRRGDTRAVLLVVFFFSSSVIFAVRGSASFVLRRAPHKTDKMKLLLHAR